MFDFYLFWIGMKILKLLLAIWNRTEIGLNHIDPVTYIPSRHLLSADIPIKSLFHKENERKLSSEKWNESSCGSHIRERKKNQKTIGLDVRSDIFGIPDGTKTKFLWPILFLFFQQGITLHQLPPLNASMSGIIALLFNTTYRSAWRDYTAKKSNLNSPLSR